MKLCATSLGALSAWIVGCSPNADLPAGWQNAAPVKNFRQAQCSGSADIPDGGSDSIALDAAPGQVNVAYSKAHFRCAQSVEGFVRASPHALDFLVQPTDMNPSSVAGCDCLYDIDMSAGATAGATTVTVYRRWDHQSGADTPVQVGTGAIAVP